MPDRLHVMRVPMVGPDWVDMDPSNPGSSGGPTAFMTRPDLVLPSRRTGTTKWSGEMESKHGGHQVRYIEEATDAELAAIESATGHTPKLAVQGAEWRRLKAANYRSRRPDRVARAELNAARNEQSLEFVKPERTKRALERAARVIGPIAMIASAHLLSRILGLPEGDIVGFALTATMTDGFTAANNTEMNGRTADTGGECRVNHGSGTFQTAGVNGQAAIWGNTASTFSTSGGSHTAYYHYAGTKDAVSRTEALCGSNDYRAIGCRYDPSDGYYYFFWQDGRCFRAGPEPATMTQIATGWTTFGNNDVVALESDASDIIEGFVDSGSGFSSAGSVDESSEGSGNYSDGVAVLHYYVGGGVTDHMDDMKGFGPDAAGPTFAGTLALLGVGR